MANRVPFLILSVHPVPLRVSLSLFDGERAMVVVEVVVVV